MRRKDVMLLASKKLLFFVALLRDYPFNHGTDPFNHQLDPIALDDPGPRKLDGSMVIVRINGLFHLSTYKWSPMDGMGDQDFELFTTGCPGTEVRING